MSDSGHTRRRVLGAGGALAGLVTLGGCGLFGDDPEPVKAPDPLQPVLDEALALAAAYDRVVLTQQTLSAKLTPLAQAHRAHAAELAKVIGATLPNGSAAPSAAAAGDTLADLRKAELAAQKTAAAACKITPAGRAALVGSIAAARATHAEALR